MEPLDLLDYEPTPRFGDEPAANALVELHNLIAAAESTAEFSRADLDRISRQRGVDLTVRYLDGRLRIYQEILEHCLANGDLGEADRDLLAHVAHTLALTPGRLREVHERAFGLAVTESISDDCLDVQERLLLYKLQHLLGLDPQIADGAYDVLAREHLLRTVARVLCDGRLSPDEAREVERVRRDLSLEIPERIQTMLGRAAQRWADEHEDLEPVHVHTTLQENETAYYTRADVTWTHVDRDNYKKVFSSKEMLQKLQADDTRRLRMPDVALEGPRLRGRVTVTSRRLILKAERRGPQHLYLSTIDEVRRFSNGVTVRTDEGWHVFFDLGERSPRFHGVLRRLIEPSAAQPEARRSGTPAAPD